MSLGPRHPSPRRLGRPLPRDAFRAAGVAGAAALLVASPTVIALLRHSPPVLAVSLAYALTVALFWDGRWRVFMGRLGSAFGSREGSLLLVLAALMLVSATWSPVPDRALVSAGQMSAGLAVAAALLVAASILDDERLAAWLSAGAAIGAVVLTADLLSQGALRGGAGLSLRATNSNRAVVYLGLAAPVLVFVALSGRRGRWIAAAALALAVPPLLVSLSASARLAAVSGLTAYGVVRLAGRPAVTAAFGAMALVVLLMPALAFVFHDAAPRILFDRTPPESVEVRALIWREFAALVEAKPWLGHGLEASAAPHLLPGPERFSEAQRYLLALGHPHNAALQIWFELGAAGAVLVAGLLFLAGRRVAALAPELRASACGVATAIFAVSCVSHGAWQVWWPMMCAIVLAGFPRPRRAEKARV